MLLAADFIRPPDEGRESPIQILRSGHSEVVNVITRRDGFDLPKSGMLATPFEPQGTIQAALSGNSARKSRTRLENDARFLGIYHHGTAPPNHGSESIEQLPDDGVFANEVISDPVTTA